MEACARLVLLLLVFFCMSPSYLPNQNNQEKRT